MLTFDPVPALHHSCCRSSKHDGCVSLAMWQGQVTLDLSRALYTSIRGLPKDWRRRPGCPRHTWLRTLEGDLQPLNHGLNSAWRLAQDREHWKQLVKTVTLKAGARPWWMTFHPTQHVILTTQALNVTLRVRSTYSNGALGLTDHLSCCRNSTCVSSGRVDQQRLCDGVT